MDYFVSEFATNRCSPRRPAGFGICDSRPLKTFLKIRCCNGESRRESPLQRRPPFSCLIDGIDRSLLYNLIFPMGRTERDLGRVRDELLLLLLFLHSEKEKKSVFNEESKNNIFCLCIAGSGWIGEREGDWREGLTFPRRIRWRLRTRVD